MTTSDPSSPIDHRTLADPRVSATAGQLIARRFFLSQMAHVRNGRIDFHDPLGRCTVGQPTEACPQHVQVVVSDLSAYVELVLGGSVGAGESYAEQMWSTGDLAALCRIVVSNEAVVHGLDRGLSRLRAPILRLLNRRNSNDRAGARRNIAAHYDLGNSFFERMLDDTMMYSAALFERPDQPLAEASRAKLKRVCQRLELGPNDHLLEIGTGWGGMALYAAEHHGCRVTTTTISKEQARYARERIDKAGLSHKVTVIESDYRDLTGQFDKIVSIEMIEAIGASQYETFFNRCGALLAPTGLMLVQAITVADQRYETAKDEVDFIKHHIFPGSCIPSINVLSQAMTAKSDFRIVHLDDITLHYAQTLREWRKNFRQHWREFEQQGREPRFLGLWDFYLAYCEAAFEERYLGDVQLLFAKPQWREKPCVTEGEKQE